MTIAAGFKCSDGVLLCADSQYSGWDKTFRDKVFLFSPNQHLPVSLGFAFAGDEDHARTAIEDCESAVEAIVPRAQNIWREVRLAVREAIKHVVGDYSSISSLDQNQKPEFLVGIRVNAQVGLFHAREMAFRRVDGLKCIGAGYYLAQFLVSHIGHPEFQRIEQFLPFVVRALASTKRHVDGCGGGSQFLVMRGSGLCSAVKGLESDELDEIALRFDALTGDLFGSLAAPITEEDFARRLGTFDSRMNGLRKALLADGGMYQTFVNALSDIPGR